ncbi:MAG: hypothetical protein R3D25_04650 [Geminicoccaceae bacterium]
MQETVPVTLLPPDVEPADIDGPRVNLYLFEVKRQAELANQMPPGQGTPAPTASRRSRWSSTIS